MVREGGRKGGREGEKSLMLPLSLYKNRTQLFLKRQAE